jgi:hypothetical protein
VLAVMVSSAPVLTAVRIGTLTPALTFLVVLAWRFRATRLVPGVALAVAIALKLFLWPLAVWLAATRRWADAAVACALAGS